jgi:hypothetical protein
MYNVNLVTSFSLRLTLCLRYRSDVIAAAAIYISLKFTDEDDPLPDTWYKDMNLELDEIRGMCFLSLFTLCEASVFNLFSTSVCHRDSTDLPRLMTSQSSWRQPHREVPLYFGGEFGAMVS